MACPGWSNSIVPKSLPALVMAVPLAAGPDVGAGLGFVAGADVDDATASAFSSVVEPPPQAAASTSVADAAAAKDSRS
jgi:hypothetical protein